MFVYDVFMSIMYLLGRRQLTSTLEPILEPARLDISSCNGNDQSTAPLSPHSKQGITAACNREIIVEQYSTLSANITVSNTLPLQVKKRGRPYLLTAQCEQYVVEWLRVCALRYRCVTQAIATAAVQELAKREGNALIDTSAQPQHNINRCTSLLPVSCQQPGNASN